MSRAEHAMAMLRTALKVMALSTEFAASRHEEFQIWARKKHADAADPESAAKAIDGLEPGAMLGAIELVQMFLQGMGPSLARIPDEMLDMNQPPPDWRSKL